jgi:hypothetical protein
MDYLKKEIDSLDPKYDIITDNTMTITILHPRQYKDLVENGTLVRPVISIDFGSVPNDE